MGAGERWRREPEWLTGRKMSVDSCREESERDCVPPVRLAHVIDRTAEEPEAESKDSGRQLDLLEEIGGPQGVADSSIQERTPAT